MTFRRGSRVCPGQASPGCCVEVPLNDFALFVDYLAYSLSLSAPLSSSALLTLFPSLFPFGIHKKSMHAKCFRDTLKLVRLLLLPLFLLLLLLPPLFVYSSNGGANRKNYVDESSVNGIYFIVTYVNCYLCHTHRASIMTSCRLNSIRFHFPYFLFFTVMLLEYL